MLYEFVSLICEKTEKDITASDSGFSNEPGVISHLHKSEAFYF